MKRMKSIKYGKRLLKSKSFDSYNYISYCGSHKKGTFVENRKILL